MNKQRRLFKSFKGAENLEAVYYTSKLNEEDEEQTTRFESEMTNLYQFAKEAKPFHCKDIVVALDEISKLEEEVERLRQIAEEADRLKGMKEKYENCTTEPNLLLETQNITTGTSSLVGIALGIFFVNC